LGKILNHKDAFLTGLGNQHLALFGSQQKLVNAKFEI
jgi:UDP-N-acetylmuramyl pentapeptide synthase